MTEDVMLEKIKLIIWDLDDTLWEGTLSESPVNCKEDIIAFIRDTADCGIIHSICSKNDYDAASDKLMEFGIWELFVFPSISWKAKGARVKRIISDMKLRANNVLFLDDNLQNLEEASYYCPDIMIMQPSQLNELIVEAKNADRKDLKHDHLKQYKALEAKKAVQSSYESNYEFLMSCNIQVCILHDCINHIDRIHDLVERSNQLNYTKYRQTREELLNLLAEPEVNAGYVTAKDKFGDYGIIGFYAVKNGEVIQFTFSCRTLGMLIEQYVYVSIGCPKLNIVGDIMTNLNVMDIPPWINQKNLMHEEQQRKSTARILLKGPCDMQQLFSFIEATDNIVTEFTYVNDVGVSVEGHNHTAQICTALFTSEAEKDQIVSEFAFFDNKMLQTAIAGNDFDVIVLSLLPECNLGVYRRKGTGENIALCEKMYDLTKPENADLYIHGEIFTSNMQFTPENLRQFSKLYEYIPDTANGNFTVCNLDRIYSYINNQCKIVLLLGSEATFTKKTKPSYEKRHLEHKAINDRVRIWAQDKANVVLLPFDRYIKSNSDYIDTINHFSKRVYYAMTDDLVSLFNEKPGIQNRRKNKTNMYRQLLRQKMSYMKKMLKGK
jgi:FkbH-like protein